MTRGLEHYRGEGNLCEGIDGRHQTVKRSNLSLGTEWERESFTRGRMGLHGEEGRGEMTESIGQREEAPSEQ